MQQDMMPNSKGQQITASVCSASVYRSAGPSIPDRTETWNPQKKVVAAWPLPCIHTDH